VKMNLKTFEDWYKVNMKDLHQHGGLLPRYRSLITMLMTVYPEYPFSFVLKTTLIDTSGLRGNLQISHKDTGKMLPINVNLSMN
jgi:hypothetical protein